MTALMCQLRYDNNNTNACLVLTAMFSLFQIHVFLYTYFTATTVIVFTKHSDFCSKDFFFYNKDNVLYDEQGI